MHPVQRKTLSRLAPQWIGVKLFRATENCVLWRSLFGLQHCSWPDFSEPICTDGVFIIGVYQNPLSGTQFVVLWVVTPCSLIPCYHSFGGIRPPVILKMETKCSTETSVSTDNYMTSQPRRPYLNTCFFVNLDSYTIRNSSIIFPGKKLVFPNLTVLFSRYILQRDVFVTETGLTAHSCKLS